MILSRSRNLSRRRNLDRSRRLPHRQVSMTDGEEPEPGGGRGGQSEDPQTKQGGGDQL